MGLTAKAQSDSGQSYDPLPTGIHQAVCIWVIDIGMHEIEWQGNKKLQHKVMLVWELPSLRGDFPNQDGTTSDKPRVISNEYTLSLSEKANLHKMLVSWRGKVFTPEELSGFDLKNILGVNCQIQVIHNPSKKDPSKIYANIANVLPAAAGAPKVEPENKPIFFSFEDHKGEGCPDIPSEIPQWIQDKITKSDTWRMLSNPQAAVEPAVDLNTSGAIDKELADLDPDSVPF